MSVLDYLRENGRGTYAQWHVPDLVPASAPQAKLAFVFESPHLHEVNARVPVVGASGRDALRFLTSGSVVGESLGCFVRKRLDADNGRIAILNVSNVPMQEAAYTGGEAPGLASGDWEVIESVRRSTSRSPLTMRNALAKEASVGLLEGLRARLGALAGAASDCQVVAAGVFARRMVGAIRGDIAQPLLEVPHPSFDQWNRSTNHQHPGLTELRSLFQQLTTP